MEVVLGFLCDVVVVEFSPSCSFGRALYAVICSSPRFKDSHQKSLSQGEIRVYEEGVAASFRHYGFMQ